MAALRGQGLSPPAAGSKHAAAHTEVVRLAGCFISPAGTAAARADPCGDANQASWTLGILVRAQKNPSWVRAELEARPPAGSQLRCQVCVRTTRQNAHTQSQTQPEVKPGCLFPSLKPPKRNKNTQDPKAKGETLIQPQAQHPCSLLVPSPQPARRLGSKLLTDREPN